MITIDPCIRRACPDLCLGAITGKTRVRVESPQLDAVLADAQSKALRHFSDLRLLDHPNISAVRQAYRRLGADPNRYRNSAESLLRRVLRGKQFPRVNNLVDANNLFTLQTLSPVGVYDLSQIRGVIRFQAGRKSETMATLGGGTLPLQGLPVFADDLGPFGSPTRDSTRTKLDAGPRRFILVVLDFAGTAFPRAAREQTTRFLEDQLGARINSTEEIR